MVLGDRKDLSGMRFGRLTVIGEHHRNEKGRYMWLCQCECGNTTIVNGGDLRKGCTKSCGCLKKSLVPKPIRTHGKSKTPLYKIWIAMRQRCENPKEKNYHRYGGRGITVCPEWGRYEVFMEWALSHGYIEGQTDIDRRDNDKGYSPENCRFISHKENLRNTHRKLHDVIEGEDITLAEAAERHGLPYRLVYQRYKRGKRGGELVEPCRN